MRTDNINEIRRLSALFYDGMTTPGQETELRDILRETDCDSLPDDLREEIGILKEILDTDLPDGFEEKLSLTIDSLARMESSSEDVESPRKTVGNDIGRWRIAAWWCSSIAAAVVLAVLFFPHPGDISGGGVDLAEGRSSGYGGFFPEVGLLASDIASQSCGGITLTRESKSTDDTESVKTADIERQVIQNHVNHHATRTDIAESLPSKTMAESVSQAGVIREVTDPVEAEMLINRAFSRVYRSMAIAKSSISYASCPDEAGTTSIDNILKNEEKL